MLKPLKSLKTAKEFFTIKVVVCKILNDDGLMLSLEINLLLFSPDGIDLQ